MVPDPVKAVSLTAMLDRVTLPVLVVKNVYVMTWPATKAPGPAGEADFTTVMAGDWLAMTTAELGVLVVVPPVGIVPVAVAVLVIWPASTSAWVVVYVAVHVVVAPTASEVVGHETVPIVPVPVNAVSLTTTLVRSVFPEFVTANE
jgi:hypothetical protein